MKFATITALVGLAYAVEIGTPNDSLVKQSAANMEQLSENMGEIDDESLEEVDADEDEERKKVSETAKQINAERGRIYTLNRSQGLCKGNRGTNLGMWRRKNASFCKKQCAKNSKCNLYLVGEGAQKHMYIGTCVIDHAPASTTGKGDGNRGWSCYKYSAV